MTTMMPRRVKWSHNAAHPLLIGAVLWMAAGGAASQLGAAHPLEIGAVLWRAASSPAIQQSPAAHSAPAAADVPAQAAWRSTVFDTAKADELRRRQQAVYVESIMVEGQDPDRPRAARRALEQTFAEALLPAPPASVRNMRKINPTPCHAVQSSLNTIGSSYAPLTGCPGSTNAP